MILQQKPCRPRDCNADHEIATPTMILQQKPCRPRDCNTDHEAATPTTPTTRLQQEAETTMDLQTALKIDQRPWE